MVGINAQLPLENCRLLGIDFSSSPTKKKPIAVAVGQWQGNVLLVDDLLSLPTLGEFYTLMLQGPQAFAKHARAIGPLAQLSFVAAIDMPFGLPRKLVEGLKWPGAQRMDSRAWSDLITYYASLTREQIRATFKAWCDARPVGHKFVHRDCESPAGSSPSMKWVNPPMAYMLHAGAPLLMQAGVHIPGMFNGDRSRVALEAYAGYWARKILNRASYKSDEVKKDTPDRKMARSELLCALEEGMLSGIVVKVRPYLRARLLDDGKADHLDAVLCCLVAAQAARRADSDYDLPLRIDPLEGWITGVKPI